MRDETPERRPPLKKRKKKKTILLSKYFRKVRNVYKKRVMEMGRHWKIFLFEVQLKEKQDYGQTGKKECPTVSCRKLQQFTYSQFYFLAILISNQHLPRVLNLFAHCRHFLWPLHPFIPPPRFPTHKLFLFFWFSPPKLINKSLKYHFPIYLLLNIFTN